MKNKKKDELNEPKAHYCPISVNVLKGHWNFRGEGEMGRREENNQGVNPKNADNYRFYESQKVKGNKIIWKKFSWKNEEPKEKIIEINKETEGEILEKCQSEEEDNDESAEKLYILWLFFCYLT